jgi:HIV Tat-specific factor 1
MIDKKNPPQNSDNDDSPDDEIIIDLTEEIDTKPKENNGILKLTEEMDTDDPLSLVRDGTTATDNDEKFFSFDEIDESESAESDSDGALTARIADAQEDPGEDQLMASANDFSLETDQDQDREITEEFDLNADEDDDILTMDAAADETEENFSLTDDGEITDSQKEKSLFDLEDDISLDYEFDNDEEDIIDLDDTDREEEDQNFANLILADSKKSDQGNENTDEFPEDDEEIIEITEFDQHFPADGEALLKHTGMLDSKDEDEKEFNELIGIDEDSAAADGDIIDFSDSPQSMDDDALDQIFSEELKEDQPPFQAPETIFNNDKEIKIPDNDVLNTIFDGSPETESGYEDEIREAAAKALNSERSPKDITDFSEDEELDLNLDAAVVAEQVDRLDTFLFKDSPDESIMTELDTDRLMEKKSGPENSQAVPEIGPPLALSPEQIDAAIERIITKRFSDKIETIIYEVIEKAVSMEINRLKNSLTGNKKIDNDPV